MNEEIVLFNIAGVINASLLQLLRLIKSQSQLLSITCATLLVFSQQTFTLVH